MLQKYMWNIDCFRQTDTENLLPAAQIKRETEKLPLERISEGSIKWAGKKWRVVERKNR